MKTNMTSNFLWRFFERIGAQGVTLVVSIVLARMLGPDVYGEIALVTVFINILQVFVDAGLANALIQKSEVDDLDYSSVFFSNVFVCCVLYIGVFLLAPFIAEFYNNLELIPIIRVLSIIILISGVKNVQQAYIARNMLFKLFFFATLGGTITAAIVGIVMASLGFGIWALVAQLLVNTAIDTLVLWVKLAWKPKWQFSIKRLSKLFGYGWKLLVSSLLETIYNESYQLLIGKFYSSSELAYFNQGKKLPNAFVSNINSSIDSIIFPAMSREQDHIPEVKKIAKKAMKVSTFCVWPVLTGMFACGNTIVYLLLGERWVDSAWFLRLYCICFAFYPIYTSNLNAIKSLGRSDLFLKMEMLKKISGISILLATLWFGLKALSIGIVLEAVTSLVINTMYSKRILNYSLLEQIKDLSSHLFICILMGVIVFFVGMIPFSMLFVLMLQITIGIVSYYLLAKLFNVESLDYIINYVKRLVLRIHFIKHK